MVAQGTGGSIVNVSSIASKLAVQTGLAAYAPSKAALDSLTQVMVLELGQHKVSLYCARNWDSTRWVCIVHGTGTLQGGFVSCTELGQHKVGLYRARNWDRTRWVCIVHGTGTAQGGFVLCTELGQHKEDFYCVRNWDSTKWVCIVHASTSYRFAHISSRGFQISSI